MVGGDEEFVPDLSFHSMLQGLSRKIKELIICWTFIWFAAIIRNQHALFIFILHVSGGCLAFKRLPDVGSLEFGGVVS